MGWFRTAAETDGYGADGQRYRNKIGNTWDIGPNAMLIRPLLRDPPTGIVSYLAYPEILRTSRGAMRDGALPHNTSGYTGKGIGVPPEDVVDVEILPHESRVHSYRIPNSCSRMTHVEALCEPIRPSTTRHPTVYDSA